MTQQDLVSKIEQTNKKLPFPKEVLILIIKLSTISNLQASMQKTNCELKKIKVLMKVMETMKAQLDSIKQIKTYIQIKAAESMTLRTISNLEDRFELSDHQIKHFLKIARDHEKPTQQLPDEAKTNTRLIGISKEVEDKSRYIKKQNKKTLFTEVMAENLPSMEESDIHISEA